MRKKWRRSLSEGERFDTSDREDVVEDIPERDKLVLRERLQKLREASGDGV